MLDTSAALAIVDCWEEVSSLADAISESTGDKRKRLRVRTAARREA
jgi:hypothetical protein